MSWPESIAAYLRAETAAGRPATTRKLRREQLTRFGRDVGCPLRELNAVNDDEMRAAMMAAAGAGSERAYQ